MKGSAIDSYPIKLSSQKKKNRRLIYLPISAYPISSQSLKIHWFCDYNTIHLMEIYVIYFTSIFLKDKFNIILIFCRLGNKKQRFRAVS